MEAEAAGGRVGKTVNAAQRQKESQMSFFFLLALVPELLAGLLNAILAIIGQFTGTVAP
jgi:hypothetical protein